jgi:hypothetical protein
MKWIIFIGIIILTVIPVSGLTQDCSKTKVYKQCFSPKGSLYENKLNWSRAFKWGQSKQFVMTFYKGKQYLISICTKKGNNNIHILLKENTETQAILFDNAINELSGILDIKVNETKKLIIEISMPPRKANESSATECVGLVLFQRVKF